MRPLSRHGPVWSFSLLRSFWHLQISPSQCAVGYAAYIVEGFIDIFFGRLCTLLQCPHSHATVRCNARVIWATGLCVLVYDVSFSTVRFAPRKEHAAHAAGRRRRCQRCRRLGCCWIARGKGISENYDAIDTERRSVIQSRHCGPGPFSGSSRFVAYRTEVDTMRRALEGSIHVCDDA